MNKTKKPFWKRVNRGAVVFLALAVLVIAHVVTTQLLLIPKKAALRELSDQVRVLAEPLCTPSDALLADLAEDKEVPQADKDALKERLRPLFGSDKQYLDAAVETLYESVYTQIDNDDFRVHSMQLDRAAVESCAIEEETAQIDMTYTYEATGRFTDWTNNRKTETATVRLSLVLSCRYEDGAWRIYRVNAADLYDVMDDWM